MDYWQGVINVGLIFGVLVAVFLIVAFMMWIWVEKSIVLGVLATLALIGAFIFGIPAIPYLL